MAGRPGGSKAANTVALGGLAFLLLRLLAVSHYNWRVAFSLSDCINFNDVIGVVVGTFLGANTFTAILLAVILPLALARHFRHVKEGAWAPHQTVLIAFTVGIFVAAVVTFRDWPTLLLILAASAVVLAVLRWSSRGRRVAGELVAKTNAIILLGLLLLAGTTGTVWVPKEIITMKNGERFEAYVMKTASPFLIVLTARDRKDEIIVATDVASRRDAE